MRATKRRIPYHFVDEVENQADELISDILANMDPFVFEELVAAVLRAMGYHAKKTRDSQDRGIDVVAHPDSLGFESPYIKAQVKRQQSKVGSPDMRAFTGTLGNGNGACSCRLVAIPAKCGMQHGMPNSGSRSSTGTSSLTS